MKECVNKKENMKFCNCTYEPCDRKGVCCECIKYHKQMNQLPACFFPNKVESTYDRSIKKFISVCK